MGAGASSGAGGAGSQTAGRAAGSVASVNYPEKYIGGNGSTGIPGNPDRVDFPSPKHARHVVIQAADPKMRVHKGGFMEKLRQMASQSNSPSQSPGTSHMGSRTGSVAGDHIASEKSQMSTRASRRDEYDVDSNDEDLEGFIYDDDSTSEDEREDYVNAFSRKKKLQRADDYSEYEGAAVRALTAGTRQGRKSTVRRSRSSTDDDDGDDEWDPEEEQIRKLRKQKRQEERAKAAAARSAASSMSGPTEDERDAGAAGPRLPMDAAGRKTQLQPQPQPPAAQSRLTPQPPPEPPVRSSSGNVRRSAAAAVAAVTVSGTPSGAGPGPGPGPGAGSGSGSGSGASPAAAGRGAVLRAGAPPPPPPPPNYGASASSQYWQSKRTQADAAEDRCRDGGQGLSRLEQLAALQKKRQSEQEQGQGRGEDTADHGSGVRWQVPPEPARAPAPSVPEPARPPASLGVEDRGVRLPQPPQQQQQQPALLRLTGPDQEQPAAMQAQTSSQRQWQEEPRRERTSDPAPERRCSQGGAGSDAAAMSPRPTLEGTSFIMHLAPPMQKGAKSGGAGCGLMAPKPPDCGSYSSRPRPAGITRGSDVTDFDVDEVLNSFAPSGGQSGPEHLQQQEQWAGSRPQLPPSTPPSKDFVTGAAPVEKRSIRAVKSDFVSMRAPLDVTDGSTDLTARILSLPAAASRPLQPGGNDASAAVQTAPPALPSTSTSTTAPAAAVSRFARMGANMLAPGGGGSEGAGAPGGGCRGGALGAGTAAPSHMIGGVAGSPVRRPQRSNHGGGGGDGGGDGTSPVMQAALTAPLADGASSSGGGAGGGAVPVLMRLNSGPRGAGASPRISIGGSGDSPLSLPVLRPSSGSSGGGARGSDSGASSILAAAAAANTVAGRSRFGTVQQQQTQQQMLRCSAPAMPIQRDYDSDSALTRGGGATRSSWNGAGNGAGARVGGPLVAGSGAGYGVMGGPAGLAPGARSRLGQVGA